MARGTPDRRSGCDPTFDPGGPTSGDLRLDLEDLLDELQPTGPILDDVRIRPRPEIRRPLRRVPAGTVLQPIEVPAGKLEGLIRRSLTEQHERLVWAEAGDEVVVDLTRTRVAVRTGVVLIAINLQTDDTQLDRTRRAVGDRDSEGDLRLLAVTPRAPEGPAGLVLRWGDAVDCCRLGALIDVVAELAQAAGSDGAGCAAAAGGPGGAGRGVGIVLQAEPEVRRGGGGP